MVTVDQKTFDIKMSRGDTFDLQMTFVGDIPGEDDTVVFSVKDSPGSDSALIEKTMSETEDGVFGVRIESADTKDLSVKGYVWDVRIFYSDGTILAPFEPKAFKLVPVVTNLRG